MGLNESIIKTITEPVNHLIDNCGHSDFKSKCCQCVEIEIDTHHDLSRDSILSNVTLIVEK